MVRFVLKFYFVNWNILHISFSPKIYKNVSAFVIKATALATGTETHILYFPFNILLIPIALQKYARMPNKMQKKIHCFY